MKKYGEDDILDPYEEYRYADYGVYKKVVEIYQESFTSMDAVKWRNYSENNHGVYKLDITYVGTRCKINISI